MKTYILVLLVLHAVCFVGRLWWLANPSTTPSRTQRGIAIDCLLEFVLIAWGIYVLAKGVA